MAAVLHAFGVTHHLVRRGGCPDQLRGKEQTSLADLLTIISCWQRAATSAEEDLATELENNLVRALLGC